MSATGGAVIKLSSHAKLAKVDETLAVTVADSKKATVSKHSETSGSSSQSKPNVQSSASAYIVPESSSSSSMQSKTIQIGFCRIKVPAGFVPGTLVRLTSATDIAGFVSSGTANGVETNAKTVCGTSWEAVAHSIFVIKTACIA